MAQMTQVLGEVSRAAAHAPHRFSPPELDGLRFYAFLGVFICHTLPGEAAFYRGLYLPLPWLWGAVVKSGAAGVDLFFALSAFLITSLLLREQRQTGEISLRWFYMRRILRIWPLYFVVVSLGIVLAHTMASQSLPWYYVAGYVLFAGNWVHAVFGHPRSVCFPLWTVSIEEQFYLIWPALMMMLERRGMIIAGVATFLLAAASQVAIALAGLSGGYIYYGSASRCDSLALGVLLALFANRLPAPTNRLRWLLVGGGLVGWVTSSAWLVDQPGPVSARMALGRLIVSLASGAILYGCLYSSSKLLRGSLIVSMGKISYGLYLLHLVGLLIAQSLFHPAWGWQLLATKAVGFVMTIILAFASYRWIESPFLRMKDRFATVLSRPV
jgi:peptidoglycan/LPS O-acetylase OafA/YrhL